MWFSLIVYLAPVWFSLVVWLILVWFKEHTHTHTHTHTMVAMMMVIAATFTTGFTRMFSNTARSKCKNCQMQSTSSRHAMLNAMPKAMLKAMPKAKESTHQLSGRMFIS